MKIAGFSPVRRCLSTTLSCPGCCMLRSCAARLRMQKSFVSTSPKPCSDVVSSPPMSPATSVTTGNPALYSYRLPRSAGVSFTERTQVPLARDKARHVGEPLVIVIAESRYIAEDALDDIDVELEQLPAGVELEKGLAGGAAPVT